MAMIFLALNAQLDITSIGHSSNLDNAMLVKLSNTVMERITLRPSLDTGDQMQQVWSIQNARGKNRVWVAILNTHWEFVKKAIKA